MYLKPVTPEEICQLGSEIKNKYSSGIDEIPTSIIKDSVNELKDILCLLINNLFKNGEFPDGFKISLVKPLFKKGNPQDLDSYRLISLLPGFSKLFELAMYKRLINFLTNCKLLHNNRHGFLKGKSTQTAIFQFIKIILQYFEKREVATGIFLDLTKAYDSLDRDLLLRKLERYRVRGNGLKWLQSFLNGRMQVVGVTKNGESSKSDIVTNEYGIVQGSILGPLLYADDTVLLASTLEDLQELLNCVADRSREMGLKLNIKKTKWLVVSKHRDVWGDLEYDGKPIERVQHYKYLGCILNAEWDNTQEIRSRIEQARGAFVKMKAVLCSRDIDLALRIRILKCYVFSVLMYGAESWTLTETMCRRLEAFEMWTYRRMLRVSWVDRVRNIDILNQLNKQTEVIHTIKKRKLEYFGHILRNTKYQILQLIMQGKIDGRRGPGRRRTSWLKNLRQWYGVGARTLFRRAVDKVQIALMIANVR
ncbi:uncharacterized protein LOC132698368 [Cylas formicarius]|uniref:uncharacterized protein LOC132698368 n=1 Tax=Cylas formicarius TaxID=197179 RepID=UPI0029588932|nr:uncharacterized protein LOC132698368 [Cylas formicarius]